MNIRNKDFKIDEPVDLTADELKLLIEAVYSFHRPDMIKLHTKLLSIGMLEYDDYKGDKDEIRD